MNYKKAMYAKAMEDFRNNFEYYVVAMEGDEVVINCPPFIPVSGNEYYKQGGIVELVSEILGCQMYLCHRLDRETSGVLLLTSNLAHYNYLRLNWHESTQKRYDAVVIGRWDPAVTFAELPLISDEGEKKVRVDSRGRWAKTLFWVKQVFPTAGRNGLSWIGAQLVTGRKHQIRVHGAYLQHPIVGDELYAPGWARSLHPRQLLHASELTLDVPWNEHPWIFTAGLPDDFSEFLAGLENGAYV